MDQDAVTREIIALERRTLDAWSAGNPAVMAEGAADDVTYFDDIAAQGRVDGAEAFRAYMRGLDGKIPPHDYEMMDPRVQVYGDIAVLTLRYHAFLPDRTEMPPWKASEVFRRLDGEWRLVHSHWSMTKAD